MIIKIDENNRVIASSSVADEILEGWIKVEEPKDFWNDPYHWLYLDGDLVKDVESIKQEEAESERLTSIATRKQLLADSDFKILKFAESLLKCSSSADMLSVISGTRDTLSDTIEERAEIRKQINALEGNPAEEEPVFEPVDFSDKLADIESALNILLGGDTE